MKKYLLYFKTLLYIVCGCIIVFLREGSLENLDIVIGTFLLLTSIEQFLAAGLSKTLFSTKSSFYSPLASFILSILILVQTNVDIEFICVIWGCIILVRSSKEINESLIDMKTNKWYILRLLEAAISIVLAVLLILDPVEHVGFHIILLGIELMGEGFIIIIEEIFAYARKKKAKISPEKEKESIAE